MGLKREEGERSPAGKHENNRFCGICGKSASAAQCQAEDFHPEQPPSFICAAGQLTEPDGGHSSLLAHLHCRADNAALLLLDIPWMLPS